MISQNLGDLTKVVHRERYCMHIVEKDNDLKSII